MLERTYNVPLRREFIKVPRYKRSKKAVTALRQFIMKHMKSDQVLIGKQANLYIWKDGIKNPPHHIKVSAVKDDEGVVKVELFGFKYEEAKKAEKKEEPKSKLQEKIEDLTKKAKKEETVKEVKAKPVEKKEEAQVEKPAEKKEETPVAENKNKE